MSMDLATREETQILPSGDIKEVYQVRPVNCGLDNFALLVGMGGGVGASFGLASIFGIDVLTPEVYGIFAATMVVLSASSGALGVGAVMKLEKYLSLGLAVSEVKPGYRLKNPRSFREMATWIREKRLILEIESPFGMPPQEIVAVKRGRKILIENINRKAPEDRWDETIATIREVYDITPKEQIRNRNLPKKMSKLKRSKRLSRNLTNA